MTHFGLIAMHGAITAGWFVFLKRTIEKPARGIMFELIAAIT